MKCGSNSAKFDCASASITSAVPRQRDLSVVPLPPLSSVTKADEGKATSFIISTGAVDRMGDTINVKGWVTRAYSRNSIVLFNHNYSAPVGRATKLWTEAGALRATVQFASTSLGQTIKTLVGEKVLNATSVGFRPLLWEWAKDQKARPGGIDFQAQELLEFSVVSVPANPEALVSLSAEELSRQRAMQREADLIKLRVGP